MTHPTAALIVEHLDLVPRLARKLRLSPNSSVWDDAIQAGRIGLIEAAARFAEGGAPFREYARKFVLGAIKDALSADTVVRPSRHALARGSVVSHIDLDAAYAFQRVPGALVDLGLEERAAEELDSRRRIAELRAAVRELPAEQREAVGAVCEGLTVAEYARRKRQPTRTVFDAFAAGREALAEHPPIQTEPTDIPTGAKVPRVT